jgi:regulator of protease activity HflC (stomatin/prohibitin superfamily)
MIGIVMSTLGVVLLVYFLAGINIIRPTHRGVVETLGRYSGARDSGFNFVFPIFQKLITVNTTEQMSDIQPQEIITKDKFLFITSSAKLGLFAIYPFRG